MGSEQMQSFTRSILLVEDSPEDMTMLRRYLLRSQGHRYSAYEASTGRQALARCKDEHFDCIILDYNLPDMTGSAFLDTLYKESTQSFLPVVVLTGRGNEMIAVQAMKLGAQDYILKEQLSPNFLHHTIESAIETMAMQRQMEEQRQELARQHHAYQTLAENAPDIIERIDTHFRHLYTNSALTRLTGMHAETFLGKTGRELGMPDDLCDRWESNLAAVFATKQAMQFEFTFILSKEERFYQAYLVPEFDEVGKVNSVLAISRDITDLKRAEEKLFEREERYRLALFGAKMGTWDWDIQTDSILWSEDLEAAVGFAPGTFGRTFDAFISLVHPDDRDFIGQRIQQALEEKSDYIVEFRMYRTDGNIRWTATRGKAIYDAYGRPVRMIGVDMDITEQKQAQQQAIERANELEGIFEAMADGLFLLKKDHSTRLNQAARDLLGAPSGTLSNTRQIPSFTILDEHGQLLPQEDWPEARLQRGEQLVGSDAADIRIRRHDGREVEVSITGAALKTAEGDVNGVIMVTRDVTVRRNLERRTHEALSALLTMAEQLVAFEMAPTPTEDVSLSIRQLADLICHVLDGEGAVLVTLEKGSEVIEHIVSSRFEDTLEQNVLAPLQGEPLSAYILDQQIVQELRAGKAVPVKVHSPSFRTLQFYPHQQQTLQVPLCVKDGMVGLISLYPNNPRHEYGGGEIVLAEAVGKLAVLVIEREHLLYDREEARANALAARETTRQMDEFISIISHELKAPLTSIKGNVQIARLHLRRILTEAGLDPSIPVAKSVQDALDRAERQVNIQNRLVNDLLDASRIRTDKLELQFELCDLIVLVQEIIEDQMRLQPTRTIHFSSTVAEALVEADAQRIGQVVNNYLSNALKYSEAGSPVEITIEREGLFVRVAVRDEGQGLAPEVQEHIWERFYRVPGVKVKSGSGVGLGLGLHICQTLIERQGGRVGVQSIQGQGSTFWFTLPLADGM